MEALIVNVRLNSLFSITLPFSWQSALIYPLMPSSAVIGMLANALQRYKDDKHPIEYLKMLEDKVEWAGSRLLSPCVIKSYIMSAITKWEDKLGKKFTNALGRQFAFTKDIQVMAIFKETVPDDIIKSLTSAPITCGDSESCATPITPPLIKTAIKENISEESLVNTAFPFPFEPDKFEGVSGKGIVYMIHERCIKKGKSFPLNSYIFPIREKEGIIEPDVITIKCKKDTNIITVEDIGIIILKK